jgi:hypothetical protein
VRRVFYGGDVPKLQCHIDDAAVPDGADFQSFDIAAAPEQTRRPREMVIGAVQHAHPAATTAPVGEQRAAAQARVGELVEAAGAAGVQARCCLHH